MLASTTVKGVDILDLDLSQYQQDVEAFWVLGTESYFHSGTRTKQAFASSYTSLLGTDYHLVLYKMA